jgi:hypothetical protein
LSIDPRIKVATARSKDTHMKFMKTNLLLFMMRPRMPRTVHSALLLTNHHKNMCPQGKYLHCRDNGYYRKYNPNNKPHFPLHLFMFSFQITFMKLTSPAFEHGGPIPSKFTCDGENISPELRIEDVPPAARSLALIMEDPDVPESVRPDRMWDHWVVWNIPPETRSIPEGAAIGVEGKNTGGNRGYGGPCPPDREHRYFFRLFALDTTLDLHEGAGKKELEQAMQGHILEKAELMGTYKRPNM